MNEVGDLITTKDQGERFSFLMRKYATPLDNMQIDAKPLGSGLLAETYPIIGKPHVLKVLHDPKKVSGNGLLTGEVFEQNALALEKLAGSPGEVMRWPSLIARGAFRGEPAQIETNLAYNPGSIVGIELEEYLKKLTMDKRFSFYQSVLVYLWLQDTYGVVTYDVKTSNLGTYGTPQEASLRVNNPDSATLLDFGTSWVEGSPYNVVSRQEAYNRSREQFLSLVGWREMSASAYWLALEKQYAGGDMLDMAVAKASYEISREKDYQGKHKGKLEIIKGWKDEQIDAEQLVRKFRDLFFKNTGKTLVF